MYDLDLPNGGVLLHTDGRHAGRAISRGQSRSLVRQARVCQEADVSSTKLDSITALTGQAMSNVVRVAQAQRHLEQLAPEASGRLAYLADQHMLAMGETLSDARRDLRRQ